MSLNSFIFKRIVMWFLTVFLILCVIHSVFSSKPEINGNALTESYNISSILSEQEALHIINTSEISNVVYDNGTYILKTEDNLYGLIDVYAGLEIPPEYDVIIPFENANALEARKGTTVDIYSEKIEKVLAIS